MNFAGYVPFRRGFLDHLREGDVTPNEALAFMVLLALANSSTGGYSINVPTLLFWIPGWSYDTADRVLRSLEDKQYIFRLALPGQKHAYRYWIDKFPITTGKNGLRNTLRTTDLSKVFETKDINDIQYVTRAELDAEQTAEHSAEQTADSNKNKNKNNKTTAAELFSADEQKPQNPPPPETAEKSVGTPGAGAGIPTNLVDIPEGVPPAVTPDDLAFARAFNEGLAKAPAALFDERKWAEQLAGFLRAEGGAQKVASILRVIKAHDDFWIDRLPSPAKLVKHWPRILQQFNQLENKKPRNPMKTDYPGRRGTRNHEINPSTTI